MATRMRKVNIHPIILAAGDSRRLDVPKPLARFGDRTALEIALANCAGLMTPVVVLGCQAARIRPAIPRGVRVVENRRWRQGQLVSLLAGLRRVPGKDAFLLYPVDYPLLTPRVIRRLVEGFRERQAKQTIVVPVFRRRPGHPVIFAPEIRMELRRAGTARDVVHRNKDRVMLVSARTPAIWRSFNSPASYRNRLREFLRRS